MSVFYDPQQTASFYPTYYAPPVGYVEAPPIVMSTAAPEKNPVAVLEEQVKDLQNKLRTALEYLHEANVLKPRYVILIEPEMEDVLVRKANPSDIFVGSSGLPGLQLGGPTEVARVQKQELYDDVITEQRQLQDGTWANVEVRVQKTRPKMRKTPIPMAKLPKGFDITEFTSETGSKLSPALLAALRRAAEKAPEPIRMAFEKATSAEWGPMVPQTTEVSSGYSPAGIGLLS